jgi:hypothetical protein
MLSTETMPCYYWLQYFQVALAKHEEAT